MLALRVVGNLKCEFRVASNGIMSTPNFIKIYPAVVELKHSDCAHFVHSTGNGQNGSLLLIHSIN
jgi:hypothetical protein